MIGVVLKNVFLQEWIEMLMIKSDLFIKKDFEPGLAVRGDEDIIDMNEIRYLELDTTELSGTSTDITNNNLDIEFSVYPNPAKNQITVDFISTNNKSSNLIISDILGKTVKEFSINSSNGINRININLNNLNDGIYFINFSNNDIKSTKKLVITK